MATYGHGAGYSIDVPINSPCYRHAIGERLFVSHFPLHPPSRTGWTTSHIAPYPDIYLPWPAAPNALDCLGYRKPPQREILRYSTCGVGVRPPERLRSHRCRCPPRCQRTDALSVSLERTRLFRDLLMELLKLVTLVKPASHPARPSYSERPGRNARALYSFACLVERAYI